MATGMNEFKEALTKPPFKEASQQSKKVFTPTLKELRCEIVCHSHYLVLEKDIKIVFASTKGKLPKPGQWMLPIVLSDGGKTTFAIITYPLCLRPSL